MTLNKDFFIRNVKISDVEKLIIFFIKAYGKQTIFQDEKFLLYYFFSFNNGQSFQSSNVIALDKKGNIISHYGGLTYKFTLSQKIIPIVWGVNAYTLPNWRSYGINSKIIDFIINKNEVNAIIGMPFEAPVFYKKLGYNIFKKDTFYRYVYVLDVKTFEIVKQINQDYTKAKKLLSVSNLNKTYHPCERIVEITKTNIDSFDFALTSLSVSSTFRDVNFLKWRLFDNPYLTYKVYAYHRSNKVISYTAIRIENLNNSSILRIIDLFGDSIGVSSLLKLIINKGFIKGYIYIDFSMYGKLYHKELTSLGFSKLKGDSICLLPQVTAPVSYRPNHEFIVIQSQIHNKLVQKLNCEDVYFTRIDGDRDRINSVSQIKN